MTFQKLLFRTYFLLLALLLVSSGKAQTQSAQQERIALFIKKVADKGEPVDKIIREFLCAPTPDMKGHEAEQRRFVVNSLEYLRKKLQGRNLHKMHVVKYKDLPAAQQTMNLDEELADDVYRVELGDQESVHVLMDGLQVASCITMTRGTAEEFLLTFCTPAKMQKAKKPADSTGRSSTALPGSRSPNPELPLP